MKKILILLLLLSTSTYAATVEERLNILTEEIEQLKNNNNSINSKLSFGGYGEIVHSKQEKGEKDTVGGEPVTDNKRFILYVGYKFDENWKLVSEIEVEHANEIYMEQAYLAHTSEDFEIKFGTLLAPLGLVNLYHEPTTFHSVQRSQTETRIIPTTWRENGVGFEKKISDFKVYAYVLSSLKLPTKDEEKGIRDGRQKASKAKSHKAGTIIRVDYNLASDHIIGLGLYRSKLNNTSIEAAHNISEVHYQFNSSIIGIRALLANATVSNTDKLKDVNSSLDLGSKMQGRYIELFKEFAHGKKIYTPFVRVETINTHASVEGNVVEDESQDQKHTTLGLSFKPVNQVVFKADYTTSTNKAKTGTNSWNVGIGWNF